MTKTVEDKGLQRVGGWCEPMTMPSQTHPFRAGSSKFLWRVERPVYATSRHRNFLIPKSAPLYEANLSGTADGSIRLKRV